MNIFCGKGERALIVGATGSGKSVMLQEQIRQARYAPVFIFDTKLDDGFDHVGIDGETSEEVATIDDFERMLKSQRKKWPTYFVIRPVAQELAEPEILDNYLSLIYEKAHHSYVMIDEAYQMHESNARAGAGLISLLTRGRSKGISTIVASQRPVWLSRFCLTEAQLFIVYQVRDIKDRLRLGEVIPYPRDLILDKFQFWAYRAGEPEGKIYAKLPLRTTASIEPEGASNQPLTWI